MPKKKTPCSKLCKEWLDKHGWIWSEVERKVPFSYISQDCFGIADLLAVKGSRAVLVQVTSRSNVLARIKKAQASEYLSRLVVAMDFVVCGVDLIEVEGKRGKVARYKWVKVLPDSVFETKEL